MRGPNDAITWATNDEQQALAEWVSERWIWEPCPGRALESDADAKLWLKNLVPRGHAEEVAIGRWIVESLLADLPGGEDSYVQWRHDFDVPQGPGVHEIDEDYHKIRITLNDGPHAARAISPNRRSQTPGFLKRRVR